MNGLNKICYSCCCCWVISVVEFQRWWVLKNKNLNQKSTSSTESILRLSCSAHSSYQIVKTEGLRHCTMGFYPLLSERFQLLEPYFVPWNIPKKLCMTYSSYLLSNANLSFIKKEYLDIFWMVSIKLVIHVFVVE